MAYEELRDALAHLAKVDGTTVAPGNINIQAIIAQQMLMATATPVLLANLLADLDSRVAERDRLLADLDAMVARRDRLLTEVVALRAALEPFARQLSSEEKTTLVVASLDVTRARVALLLSGSVNT